MANDPDAFTRWLGFACKLYLAARQQQQQEDMGAQEKDFFHH
jgi:hypothetical protein